MGSIEGPPLNALCWSKIESGEKGWRALTAQLDDADYLDDLCVGCVRVAKFVVSRLVVEVLTW
jgi:hypothetical protein